MFRKKGTYFVGGKAITALILALLTALSQFGALSVMAVPGAESGGPAMNGAYSEPDFTPKMEYAGLAPGMSGGRGGDGGGNPGGLERYEAAFAEDRVIVKLNYAPSARSRSIMPDLGVAFSESRLLNPAKEPDGSPMSGAYSAPSDQNNVYVLTLEETGADAVENALAMLNANPLVEIAEPDYIYRLCAAPNDPLYNTQYALERINAELAWDITTGSGSVVVGVIDTGIDGTHPDLAPNLWVNPNPNQNGYINDIHGYNFINRAGGVPTDYDGHGTHVAGIIGAKGNNGEGVSGINWDVSLAWLGIGFGDEDVFISAVIEALNYANNHDITITNNSYGGGPYSAILEEAIQNYKGLFVAAAGNYDDDNDLFPFYPASYDSPNIIAVASTDDTDQKSYFSNYGENSVHIAAPGSDIMSAGLGGGYRYDSGTSMASPYVAGVAALIKARRPDYTAEQVRDLLLATARQTQWTGKRDLIGSGIVDAYSAVSTDWESLVSVTYDFNDGERGPVSVKAVPGRRLLEPASPSRDGYAFAGWFVSGTAGEFDFMGTVDGDLLLVAKWVESEAGMYIMEFPDANFRREVLLTLYDQFGERRKESDMLTEGDKDMLASVPYLNVSYKNIRDITGLAYFTGLMTLYCNDNPLGELDVSMNKELISLYCMRNDLIELDVSECAKLEVLYTVQNFELSKLDVSGNTALRELSCSVSKLTELDVSNNTDLELFNCSENLLYSLTP